MKFSQICFHKNSELMHNITMYFDLLVFLIEPS